MFTIHFATSQVPAFVAQLTLSKTLLLGNSDFWKDGRGEIVCVVVIINSA